MQSVFEGAHDSHYPFRYAVSLHVDEIHGGTPRNDEVAIDHIRRQLAGRDDMIRAAVADHMLDHELTRDDPQDVDDAAIAIAIQKNLNGFRRDDQGLFIEGRHLKAALKEGVSVAANADDLKLKGWGVTNKWVTKWFPEHVFVTDTRLHLGREKADGIAQRFVTSRHGTGITLEEYVLDAKLSATIVADYEVGDDDWAAIWTRAEHIGVGASRSQGYGTFAVTQWDRITDTPPKPRARKRA